MKSITQDMRYRKSLMEYSRKWGVAQASRKYNRCRSYIYFWLKRYDGTMESLRPKSKRPHHHPSQHTPEELTLLTNMRRRNPELGLLELWSRMRKRGYTRRWESMYRVMKRLGMLSQPKAKKVYQPKPYEQMTYPGERVQMDVKVVPSKCIAKPGLKLYQYTAIDEFSRLRFLAAYEEQSTYSSADFLQKATAWFKRRGVVIECVQTDNGKEFTNRFVSHRRNTPTLFEHTAQILGIRHKLIRPYTPRHNGKVERSHREDQKRFYAFHRFFSLEDFGGQLAAHQRKSNDLPMRPLKFHSPREFLASFFLYSVQYV